MVIFILIFFLLQINPYIFFLLLLTTFRLTPQIGSAKDYLMFVEDRYCFVVKSLASTLMALLMTIKFNGSRSV